MAIVTSMPQQNNDVMLYDIPDAELQKYRVQPEKAAQMFPEKEAPKGVPTSEGAQSSMRIENAEGLQGQDVQAYTSICVCRRLVCNRNGWCKWFYYYCYC